MRPELLQGMAEREMGLGAGAEWSSAWNTGGALEGSYKPAATTKSDSSAAPAPSSNAKMHQKHLLLSPSNAAAAVPPSSISNINSYASAGNTAANINNSNTGAVIATSPSGSAAAAAPSSANINENDKVYWLIVELLSPQTREAALLELSKKREQWDDLALVLWHSFGGFPAALNLLLEY